MATSSAILRLLMIPAILLAIWMCPCVSAENRKRAEPTNDSHACCKHADESKPAKEEHHCPHCDGSNVLAMEKHVSPSLQPSLSLDFNFVVDLLPICGGQVPAGDLYHLDTHHPAHAPPLRLTTCTFLF